MRIYIDEAGEFVAPPSAQSLFSLVLAVVVPSSAEGALFTEVAALRDGWSNHGNEIKGSKLNESQAAQLVELASRHDVFVNFFAVHAHPPILWLASHGLGVWAVLVQNDS
jgi:hypothetical protein